MRHRAHVEVPEITFGTSACRQIQVGLMDDELEEVDQAVRRRQRKLGQAKQWFTREENARLIWWGYFFGLLCGIVAGLVTGFGYAGGFN